MKRTKIGNFMHKITCKASEFLGDHIWLYYVLNYTWGLLMTLVGWIVIGIMYCLPKKWVKERGTFGPAHFAIIGNNWGGLELGINFLVADKMGDSWTFHTMKHELGHTFQNAIYGPLAIFLIYIPSCIRYWYRKLANTAQTSYDTIWFEGSATVSGEYYFNKYIKKD